MLTSIIQFVNRSLSHAADHGTEDMADADEFSQEGGEPEWTIDTAGWLRSADPKDRDLVRVPSVRSSKLVGKHVEGVVWHWTATAWGTGAAIAKRMATFNAETDRAASCHVLVEHDGTATQLVPFTRGSWCQGGPSAKKFVRDPTEFLKGRDSPWVFATKPGTGVSGNAVFAGVELVNLGQLKHVNGAWRAWPFEAKSTAVAERDTVERGGARFHRFPVAQVIAAQRLLRALVRAYGLTRPQCRWTHAQIDPGRKTDPGPVWAEDHLIDVLDHAFR